MVARYRASHRAITNSDQEAFTAYCREGEDALQGIGNRHITVKAINGWRNSLRLAVHFRWLTKKQGERQIHRIVLKQRIAQPKMLCIRCFANHRKRASLARTNITKGGKLIRVDRHHITLLRFVTPNLERTHTLLVARDVAQLKITAAASVFHQLWEGITQPSGANIMDKCDWVIRTTLPAAVDNFLTASLNLGVLALHRGKIQIFGTGSTCHGGCGTTTQTNQHCWAAQNNQLRASRERGLIDMLFLDVAETTGNHDGLVIATHTLTRCDLKGSEVAA